MNAFFTTLNKHPVAVFSYIIYLLLLCRDGYMIYDFDQQLKLHPEKSGLANDGEAVAMAVIFTFGIGIIFSFIMACFAIAAKRNKFYLWLLALIIFPLVILGSI